MEETKRPVSAIFLLCLSVLLLLGTFMLYGVSDVHHTFDFLAPLTGFLLFVFNLGLFKGKLWGLLGYTVVVVGALVAIFIYAIPKGELRQWVLPIGFISILLLITIDYWTRARAFFS